MLTVFVDGLAIVATFGGFGEIVVLLIALQNMLGTLTKEEGLVAGVVSFLVVLAVSIPLGVLASWGMHHLHILPL